MNPAAQSHEALKEMTDSADPAGSQAVADTWSELAAGFDEAAELFGRTLRGSEPGWSGETAEAMRAQLARIAEWASETGAVCRAAGAAIGAQSEAAGRAKRKMPAPVPYDPAQMIRDAQASGDIFELAALPFSMHAQKQAHDAAHEEAVRVVAERDRALGTAAAQVPEFEPPPSMHGAVGEPAADQGHRGPAPVPVHGVDNHRPAATARPVRHGADLSNPAPAPVAAVAVPIAAAPASPAPAAAAAVAAPAFPAPSPAGGGHGGATTAESFMSGPAVAGFAGTEPAVPGRGFGPGATAEFGPAGGVSAAGVTGGFGTARPVSPAHLAAAAADRHPGNAAAVAGGRSDGAKDAERKRPEYLIEPEPDEVFGSTELASPPVIGQG